MICARPAETPSSGISLQDPLHGSLYLVLVSAVAAMGGLLFGYDTAVISGAIGLLQAHFSLGPAATGWAASSALAGCIPGACIAGFAGDALGRRRILLLSACCFLVSALGTALASSFSTFILFRIVGGMGIGAASMASPLYISEIAPARCRGRLVAINQLAIVVGMLAIYAINYCILLRGTQGWHETTAWRWMFASGIAPSVLLLGLLCLVPETAQYLQMKGKHAEAARVLARTGAETIPETDGDSAAVPIPRQALLKVLRLGIVLAILQQVTGINVFLYYAPQIFGRAGHPGQSAFLETVLVGAANLVFTLLAIALVDRVGRRPMLIAGSLGMAICLLAMDYFMAGIHSNILLLAFALAYIACFAFSVGPVTWIVLSEIFPVQMRARCMALATTALWLANFLVSQTFPMLDQNRAIVSRFGHGFPFMLYAFFCIFEAGFVWRNLPETKNRSLEDISTGWSTAQI